MYPIKDYCVTKLDAVVEYLGADYPLYFTSLDEVPQLLANEAFKCPKV
jgi:hypothetical protein